MINTNFRFNILYLDKHCILLTHTKITKLDKDIYNLILNLLKV
jgi:hypothetical protein